MILGVDSAIATCGYAVVDPRTKVVVALGVVQTERDATIAKSTDRARRVRQVVAELGRIATEYAVTTIAAEAMLLFGNVAAATAQSLCWGALVALAELRGLELREVVARDWQHAVLPGSKKISYPKLEAALARFVGARLLAIPKTLQTHALDAVGVGVYAALRGARVITKGAAAACEP